MYFSHNDQDKIRFSKDGIDYVYNFLTNRVESMSFGFETYTVNNDYSINVRRSSFERDYPQQDLKRLCIDLLEQSDFSKEDHSNNPFVEYLGLDGDSKTVTLVPRSERPTVAKELEFNLQETRKVLRK